MKIVITGISQGIGKALVEEFLKNEHLIVGTTRNKSSISKELLDNPQLKVFESGFNDFNDYQRFSDFISNEVGTIDILINNAGALVKRDFTSISEEDFDRSVDVNFKMPFFITQKILPHIKSNGHIVNISSRGGVQGSPKFAGLSAYSSTKGALNVLTECLNEEFDNVKVNSLSLGAVQTEMLNNAFPGYKAPITASTIAKYIYTFALTGGEVMSGQNISVSLTNP